MSEDNNSTDYWMSVIPALIWVAVGLATGYLTEEWYVVFIGGAATGVGLHTIWCLTLVWLCEDTDD